MSSNTDEAAIRNVLRVANSRPSSLRRMMSAFGSLKKSLNSSVSASEGDGDSSSCVVRFRLDADEEGVEDEAISETMWQVGDAIDSV